jgi:hypothetical protein
MERARRSLEVEHLRRTLLCPTWRHGVAFPTEYIIKPCGTRKARMCCDGSNRATPELRFAQTYALCIYQPCMRFFALSPTQPTYVRIDDACVNWYRSRHGKLVDRSMVLPVLEALQRHSEAGALWAKHTNKILDDLDIMYTTHERSIYRGTIDGKVVLLCRQVDDIAVAYSCGARVNRFDWKGSGPQVTRNPQQSRSLVNPTLHIC